MKTVAIGNYNTNQGVQQKRNNFNQNYRTSSNKIINASFKGVKSPITRIPLQDLAEQYKSIKKDVLDVAAKVLESGTYTIGRELKKVEATMKEYMGTKNAVGVASGTDAIVLTLRALNIGRGDEVITTPFSFLNSFIAYVS